MTHFECRMTKIDDAHLKIFCLLIILFKDIILETFVAFSIFGTTLIYGLLFFLIFNY